MTNESAAILDEAWGHIPQSRDSSAEVGTFTRMRVERIISVSAGFGSLALGAQSLVAALGSTAEAPGWHEPLMLVVFVPLALMILACFLGRGVRIAGGTFALLYVVVLAIWPIATAGVASGPADVPWIWYLVNIATLASVLAFPLALQIVWTTVAPLLYGVVRLIQGGFDEKLFYTVMLDVSFALILGGVLLTLGWVLRSVAVGVDETRARAVDSYSRAAAADAAEQERIAVAALMHDSVLAALIAAERADTPRGRTLAVAMAREALTRLANTEQDSGEGSDEPKRADTVADELEAGAREVGVSVVVARDITEDALETPGRVGRALALAATQAIANAVQHAGGVGLEVALQADSEHLRIEVRDAGEGFDLAAVPDDRLGIRASIVARVAAIGGTADLQSDSAGTTVRLEWQRPVIPPPRAARQDEDS